jgi:hypothetical protein
MKKSRICAILLGAVLLTTTAMSAMAGTEPSPFREDTGKLESVANNLESVEKRLDDTLAMPPDPYKPGFMTGSMNKLEEMDKKLGLLYERTNAVLQIPPDPYTPEFVDALEHVFESANGIVDIVDAFLSMPPDPYSPAFLELVGEVGESASLIASLADEYLDI